MKWDCYGIVSASKYLGTVEADTQEQAQGLALDLPECHISLCHQCASQMDDPEIGIIQVEKAK